MGTINKVRVIILGSTGSIGRNTLEVIASFPGRFQVAGLAAGANASLLLAQAAQFKPVAVSLLEEKELLPYREAFERLGVKIFTGRKAAKTLVEEIEADIVVSAITGIEALEPTLAAVRQARRVALANKEAMVVAGSLIKTEATASGAEIIPVDSEHCGVFQCLRKEKPEDVRRVVLTASGGPFLRTPLAELARKTVSEALAHPRWKMGKKVTIDSATLMNKGLELLEARWLFDLKPEQLGILIHPQSVVHSLVEFKDGSILAQLSTADMRLPIEFALCYPERGEMLLPPLNLSEVGRLEFFEVEESRFPLIRLARQALARGGSLPVVLNAANEVAVAAFLEGRIGFTDIMAVVETVVEQHSWFQPNCLEAVLELDLKAREQAINLINQRL
ncbi:MAG: 1-deoxy-D-xylulose-5-phosphate reductoisomerase [Candidatus Aminicenantales bacterium]